MCYYELNDDGFGVLDSSKQYVYILIADTVIFVRHEEQELRYLCMYLVSTYNSRPLPRAWQLSPASM